MYQERDDVTITYVRGYVHHSMSSDPSLIVYVASNCATEDVYSAQCNCVAGLGEECNHVMALLFYVEDANKRKTEKLPEEFSKTSQPMLWN